MFDLLAQLNAVPGVVGTLVAGTDGRVVAHAFPPTFDGACLAEAARAASESGAGLLTVVGRTGLLDLRCTGARILVRPIAGGTLLFLCAPDANVQPLTITASVLAPIVEKRLAARAATPAPAPTPPPAQARGAPANGRLHAAVLRINAAIERRRLDPFTVRGEIALHAGFGLGFIDADTPDDARKLAQLEAAAAAVLGETV